MTLYLDYEDSITSYMLTLPPYWRDAADQSLRQILREMSDAESLDEQEAASRDLISELDAFDRQVDFGVLNDPPLDYLRQGRRLYSLAQRVIENVEQAREEARPKPADITLTELLSNLSNEQMERLTRKLLECSSSYSCYGALGKLYPEEDKSEKAREYRQFLSCHNVKPLNTGNPIQFEVIDKKTGAREVLNLANRKKEARTNAMALQKRDGTLFLQQSHQFLTQVTLEENLRENRFITVSEHYPDRTLLKQAQDLRRSNSNHHLATTVDMMQQLITAFTKIERQSYYLEEATCAQWQVDDNGTLRLASGNNLCVVADSIGLRSAHADGLGRLLYGLLTGHEPFFSDFSKNHRRDPVFSTPMGRKLEQLMLGLTQDEPDRQLSFEEASIRLAALSPEANRLVHESPETYLKYAASDLQEEVCRQDPSKNFKYADTETQIALCNENGKEFLPYASEAMINSLCHTKPECHLALLNHDQQVNFCLLEPHRLLHTTPAVQDVLTQERPEIFLKHATADRQMALCREEPERYLNFAAREVQSQLCMEIPEMLKHADKHTQADLFKVDFKKYFKFTGVKFQTRYCQNTPETFVSIASEEIQTALCRSASEQYLKHADITLQKALCREHPKQYIHDSAKEVQLSLARESPDTFFQIIQKKHAKELCESEPETFFKHASMEMQSELCKQSPRKFLKYAVTAMREQFCNANPRNLGSLAVEIGFGIDPIADKVAYASAQKILQDIAGSLEQLEQTTNEQKELFGMIIQALCRNPALNSESRHALLDKYPEHCGYLITNPSASLEEKRIAVSKTNDPEIIQRACRHPDIQSLEILDGLLSNPFLATAVWPTGFDLGGLINTKLAKLESTRSEQPQRVALIEAKAQCLHEIMSYKPRNISAGGFLSNLHITSATQYSEEQVSACRKALIEVVTRCHPRQLQSDIIRQRVASRGGNLAILDACPAMTDALRKMDESVSHAAALRRTPIDLRSRLKEPPTEDGPQNTHQGNRFGP